MKKIQAIFDLFTSDDLPELLAAAGVPEVALDTVKDVTPGERHIQRYRGVEYRIDYRPKIRTEFAVEDWACEPTLDALFTALRQNPQRDGTVKIIPCEDVAAIDGWETVMTAMGSVIPR